MANPTVVAPPSPALALARPRPLTLLYTTLFAAIAVAGFYFVRIVNTLNGVPVHLQDRVELARHEDGTPLRTTYTGISAIDAVLSWMVAAFAAGPFGFDDGVRLQQMHFLVTFFAVLCVWNVEAYRPRNAGRLVSFPGTWAIFYQTVAGAGMIPLYHLSYTLASADSSYLDAGRALPLPAARAILPATVLLYLVPTIAMYLPLHDAALTQALIAFWQVTPVLASAAIWPLSHTLTSPASSPEQARNQDTKHLARIYTTAFTVGAVAHLCVIAICLASPSPQTSLVRVFLPDNSTWKESTTLGLHWIFQWDWWGVYVSSLLWCWVAVGDVQRRLTGTAQYVKTLVVLVGAAVVVGPAAVQAGVWWWREARLEAVEECVKSKKA